MFYVCFLLCTNIIYIYIDLIAERNVSSPASTYCILLHNGVSYPGWLCRRGKFGVVSGIGSSTKIYGNNKVSSHVRKRLLVSRPLYSPWVVGAHFGRYDSASSRTSWKKSGYLCDPLPLFKAGSMILPTWQSSRYWDRHPIRDRQFLRWQAWTSS